MHEVRTIDDMNWPPQVENGELLRLAEATGLDVLLTSDQSIRHQQNLSGRKIALVVLGSNTWPVVHDYEEAIAVTVERATQGSCQFIEMEVPPNPGGGSGSRR